MKQAHVDANANMRKLTKTLYEADDTCPTPFSWDFHDPGQQKVSVRVYEVGRVSRAVEQWALTGS